MCEAHVYVLKNGIEEKILENVDQIFIENDEIRLLNIFGDQKIIKARIKAYFGSERRILLESIE